MQANAGNYLSCCYTLGYRLGEYTLLVDFVTYSWLTAHQMRNKARNFAHKSHIYQDFSSITNYFDYLLKLPSFCADTEHIGA